MVSVCLWFPELYFWFPELVLVLKALWIFFHKDQHSPDPVQALPKFFSFLGAWWFTGSFVIFSFFEKVNFVFDKTEIPSAEFLEAFRKNSLWSKEISWHSLSNIVFNVQIQNHWGVDSPKTICWKLSRSLQEAHYVSTQFELAFLCDK